MEVFSYSYSPPFDENIHLQRPQVYFIQRKADPLETERSKRIKGRFLFLLMSINLNKKA